MISSSNHLIISFDGNHGDLPPNNYSEDDLDIFDFWQAVDKIDLLKNSEYSSDGKNLNQSGFQKIFFNTLSRMEITGKVNVSSIDANNNPKTINLNENGVPKSATCN